MLLQVTDSQGAVQKIAIATDALGKLITASAFSTVEAMQAQGKTSVPSFSVKWYELGLERGPDGQRTGDGSLVFTFENGGKIRFSLSPSMMNGMCDALQVMLGSGTAALDGALH
ncbi:MAG TPA: hypothetical protein VFI23_07955 [Rhizomicrobium sp.]|nr:hypothetical protein [Rhizomicrobium sp.]